jgi:hypothetical protein
MTIEGDPMVTVGKFETGHLPTFSKDSLSNVQKSMEENERMQREELEEMKPQWLVEYDQAQAKAQQAQKTKAKGASG